MLSCAQKPVYSQINAFCTQVLKEVLYGREDDQCICNELEHAPYSPADMGHYDLPLYALNVEVPLRL